MEIKRLYFPSWGFILTIWALLTIFFVLMFWFSDPDANPKYAALMAGFASAFLVAFFQTSSAIIDAIKLKKYEKLGVIEILENGRRGRDYYGKLVSSASREIRVMGVTASRFMSDFGQISDKNNELHLALSKGVRVRLLLPKLEFMREVDRTNFIKTTLPAYDNIKQSCQGDISIKYFDHIAAHSIVVIDDICIAGPVFPNMESKHTPAIVLKSDSEFAKTYIAHFKHEWNSSYEKYE